MLIYSPAFDTYHCVFRVLRLLAALPKATYDIDRIRVLDFYLLFPATLEHVTFPREAVRYRRLVREKRNRYERIEDPRRIFDRLQPYQFTALRFLAARNVIEPKLFTENKVQRTAAEFPPALATALSEANSRESGLIELLTGPFRNLELYGATGLRGRTQLFEYRYDPNPTVSVS
jgi:hypothetical protein